MKISEVMTTINNLKAKKIEELNKSDVICVFESINDDMIEVLEYVGCEVNHVADLLNVKLPSKKFTKVEIANQKRLEKMYESII